MSCPSQKNVTGGGFFQPGNDAQHGALAAAGRAQEANQLALRDLKRKPVEQGQSVIFLVDIFTSNIKKLLTG